VERILKSDSSLIDLAQQLTHDCFYINSHQMIPGLDSLTFRVNKRIHTCRLFWVLIDSGNAPMATNFFLLACYCGYRI